MTTTGGTTPFKPEAAVTDFQAFALHMSGLFNDCVNHNAGLLKAVAERLDPEVRDRVHGSLRDFLLKMADDLMTKKFRACGDCVEAAGGKTQWLQLVAEDVQSGWTVSDAQWRKKEGDQ